MVVNARECKTGDIKGDAFIFSDGKKVKVIKGTDIPDPSNKIIMIFNKGGWKVDKKLYKEMKKKGAGHYLVSYSCFSYYHPKIIEFIESKI